MKEKSYLFNGLQNQRYTITAVCNVSPQVSIFGFGSTSSTSAWELTMNITYQELAIKLKSHFGKDLDGVPTTSTQQYRNHLSTLHSYLAFQGKTLESRVGLELSSGYDDKLANYLASIVVADRTKRDRRLHLNLVRRLFEESKKATAPVEKTTALSTTLQNALAAEGIAPKMLAKQIGVSPSSLRQWLRGATPNQRGVASLRRVEAALKLSRDALVNLIPKVTNEANPTLPEISYRAQMRARIQDVYALPEKEMSTALRNEWRDWLDAKTTGASSERAKGERRWRLLPPEKTLKCSRLAMIGDSSCPTADWALDRLRQCLGWMRRPKDRDGGGYAPEVVQSLAWFARPEVVEGFLQFLTQRSDRLKHGGQAGFARYVNLLTRPQRGYLWRHPELRFRLPENFQPASDDAWRTLCAETTAIADSWIRESSDKNRRPAEPVAALLASDEPLSHLLGAVEKIDQLAAKARPGGLAEARHRRNALLIAFLISNPLRLRTISTLTWTPDNQGDVYQTANGRWRIRLSSISMKNGENEFRRRPYDVEVSEWVGELLSSYLEEFRPVILKGVTSRYFFVGAPSVKPWSSLDNCFQELTQQHIPACLGFGPHTVRHIVATNWLASHPNDFLTVAELLNDRLQTVMAEYAHLKRDTSLGRHSADIDALRAARMSR